MNETVNNHPATSTQRRRELWGLVTPIVYKAVTYGSRIGEFFTKQFLTAEQDRADPYATASRVKRVDTLVVVCLAFGILSYILSASALLPPFCWVLVVLFAVLRIIDIMCSTMKIVLFNISTMPEPVVASTPRVIILGFINYIELVILFACFYALRPDMIHNLTRGDSLGALYLSAITMMTVGYGDLAPMSWMRIIAAAEPFLGLFLIILLIGKFVSVLPSVRSLDRPASPDSHKAKP